jgi:hypothetical protein
MSAWENAVTVEALAQISLRQIAMRWWRTGDLGRAAGRAPRAGNGLRNPGPRRKGAEGARLRAALDFEAEALVRFRHLLDEVAIGERRQPHAVPTMPFAHVVLA